MHASHFSAHDSRVWLYRHIYTILHYYALFFILVFFKFFLHIMPMAGVLQVSDFMTTGPRTIFSLVVFFFWHICLHFSLNNVDGSHSAGLWCYYSRPLLTQLGGTGDQRCICLYTYILTYVYIYIFLYWGAPGIKDVYIHTYIFIYLGALGIKSFSTGKDIYSFPGELLSRNWYYCCIGIIIWFCHSLRNIKEEVALWFKVWNCKNLFRLSVQEIN